MDDQEKGHHQYEEFVEAMKKRKPMAMGLMPGWTWYDDPRRLAFLLSRYKFVSKLLDGSSDVLEVGCADGFGARVVGTNREEIAHRH